MNPLAAQMLEAISALPPERFAVLDGALFADLPADLQARGLEARPLYLAGADITDVRAGPYLVRVPHYEAAHQVLDLVGDLSTGVFWSEPGGMGVLFRHLRRLNAVQIARVDDPVREEDWQTMLFRHADPAVLGMMIAVMEPAQKAELMGSSLAILCGGAKWGQVSVLRAEGWVGSEVL